MLRAIIFLSFTSSCLSFSQNFDVQISAPYEVVDAPIKEYYDTENEVIAIKIEGTVTTIQKFTKSTLKEVSRKVYEDHPKGTGTNTMVRQGDNVHFFYDIWDKSTESEQLFVRTINLESGTYSGAGRLLFKVKGKINAGGGGFSFTGSRMTFGGSGAKFDFFTSWDQSLLMVQYRKKPTEKDDDLNYDIIGFGVFDDAMAQVSLNEIKMPYTESKMNNLDYTIDSDGNIYAVTLIYNDDSQKLQIDGKVNYHLEVLRIESGSTEVSHTPIKVEGIHLNKISLFNQPDNAIVCAGFYTKSTNLDNADGVIMFKIEPEGDLFDYKTYEIPVEVLNMYMSERQQEKNEKKDDDGRAEFAELEMRDMILYEDGSIVLTGEQYYIIEHTTVNAQGQRSTYYTYHYNDILALKIDPNGDMAWMKKLGKRQTGRAGRGGMSFSYFDSGDKHYFLFLDNVKNLSLTLDQRPYGHTDGAGGFFTSYVIDDETGDVSKASLFDVRDVKGIEVFQFTVSRIVQISATEFVVEVYKKDKEDMLIKVNVSV